MALTELEIKLRRTGGSGPNSQWSWELVDSTGKVHKSGFALGEDEHGTTLRSLFDDPLGATETEQAGFAEQGVELRWCEQLEKRLAAHRGVRDLEFVALQGLGPLDPDGADGEGNF